jgi:hypothetical protein
VRERQQLETLSDDLARLLQHADLLLEEWKAHGERLRRELEAQAAGLTSSLGQAVDAAARTMAPRVVAELERELGRGLGELSGELAALREAAGRAQADRVGATPAALGRRGRRARSLWLLPGAAVVLAAAANVLLVVLLVRGHPTGPGASASANRSPPDAATPASPSALPAATLPEPARLCERLGGGPDRESATAWIRGCAALLCTPDRAERVTANTALSLASPPALPQPTTAATTGRPRRSGAAAK